jgi:hypothetical protein
MEPRPVVIDPPENVNTGSPSSTMWVANATPADVTPTPTP